MSIVGRALGALLVLLSACQSADAGKRVALVIGNSAYRHANELANPKNDAADISAALRRLGFVVIEGADLDKAAADRKIREFATALSGADAGVFFYAGHGLQVGGVNYIVPVDAELSSAAALDFEMVRLDLVQRTMEREAKTNILFLDACRDNPLARNLARAMGTRSAEVGRGLAAAEAGVGTLISFSTQPGNVALDGAGRNSPFASALVKHITADGDGLADLLIAVRNDVMQATASRQVPWEHSALTGRFYFKIPSQKPVATSPPAPGTAMLEAERDARDDCKGIIARVGTADRCVMAGEVFKDCPDCPEMVVVPEGSFAMAGQHEVVLARPFAVGRFEVTFAAWGLCVRGGGCANNQQPNDQGWGRGRHPVINVSWRDAHDYVAWLTQKTGNSYRLLSDAEWEYAARGGTSTPFTTGQSITTVQANFNGSRQRTIEVGSFPPNAFGLHDVHGNASEWVEDCWNDTIDGVPADGSPQTTGDCNYHVIRGGSWAHDAANVHIAARFKAPASGRGLYDGFRVARTLAR